VAQVTSANTIEQEHAMRIGILGAGMIGGTLGPLWVKAGHQVRFGTRHPEKLQPLVEGLGPGASSGTAAEAAAFGEVVLLAVPLAALPELASELSALLAGKVVLDALNPYVNRDGALAQAAVANGQGSALWTASHLPGAKVVKAFNTVYFKVLESQAHRAGDRVGIPLAADDDEARDVAARLVRDAGFDPVAVGGLAASARFDVGTPVYNTGMSGTEVRQALGVGRE
jgi:8-hydroxy-5-deazaflavin:NADPH oxidoreductase